MGGGGGRGWGQVHGVFPCTGCTHRDHEPKGSLILAPASWTVHPPQCCYGGRAAVLCRFGSRRKAPEDWRTPKPGGRFTLPSLCRAQQVLERPRKNNLVHYWLAFPGAIFKFEHCLVRARDSARIILARRFAPREG